MNLEIKGVAASPQSWTHATSQAALAKGWRAHSQASETRPQEVPSLDLGKLGDSDDEVMTKLQYMSTNFPEKRITPITVTLGDIYVFREEENGTSLVALSGPLIHIQYNPTATTSADDIKDTYVPLRKEYPRLGPPDSSSTVSWGTRLNTPYAQHDQKQVSLTQLKTVPENLPPASDRYRLQYQQYEEDMKNGYKQYTMREKNKPSARQDNKEGERPEDGGFTAITPFDDKVCLQHCYTSKPYTAQHSLRKLEAEDLAAERRKQFVVEQVMIDQLSRAVISDPEQNVIMSFPNNAEQDLTSAPLRFRKRTLHETKIKTSSTLTENMLSNKLRFDARILCRNGRDACRELIGFFFTHDKSITIYEYRQFGKNRTNALPFIQKGIYLHKCGRRRGKPYEIEDFYPGADLTFLTAEHQSLSESLRQNPILIIRITVIDEEALNSLRAICKGNKWDLGNPWNDEENIRLALQEAMKEKLKKREVRTLTGLAKYFRQLDISGSGCLGKAEFKQALQMYHLDISEKIFESFWLILNENNQGRVDYRTFIRALVGEMNEYRKSFVRKAFMKLDPNKTGVVSMVDIRKFYCAKKHPQVLAGSSSEEEIKSAFLETLENACSNPQQVSYSEFEDYYEGLSIGIMSDEDFINILRNSWGI